MDPLTITSIFKLGAQAIDRLFPDPAEKARQLMELQKLEQTGDLARLKAHVDLLLAQIEVNKIEAGSSSLFVAGWRPFIGWMSGVGLGLAFIPKAVVLTILWAYQAYVMLNGCIDSPACDIATYQMPPFPDLGVTDLLGLLGAMLGIGTMRTIDKHNGKDTKAVG